MLSCDVTSMLSVVLFAVKLVSDETEKSAPGRKAGSDRNPAAQNGDSVTRIEQLDERTRDHGADLADRGGSCGGRAGSGGLSDSEGNKSEVGCQMGKKACYYLPNYTMK